MFMGQGISLVLLGVVQAGNEYIVDYDNISAGGTIALCGKTSNYSGEYSSSNPPGLHSL